MLNRQARHSAQPGPADEYDEREPGTAHAPAHEVAADPSGDAADAADAAEMARRRTAADWSLVGAIQALLNDDQWISTEEARVLLAERAGLATARDDVVISACKRYRHRHEGRAKDTEPWGTLPPDTDWTPRPNELACRYDYLGRTGLERAKRGERAWLTYTIYRPSVDLLRLNTAEHRGRGRVFGSTVAKKPASETGQPAPRATTKTPKRRRRMDGDAHTNR